MIAGIRREKKHPNFGRNEEYRVIGEAWTGEEIGMVSLFNIYDLCIYSY